MRQGIHPGWDDSPVQSTMHTHVHIWWQFGPTNQPTGMILNTSDLLSILSLANIEHQYLLKLATVTDGNSNLFRMSTLITRPKLNRSF